MTRASYGRGVAIDCFAAQDVEDQKLTVKNYDGGVIHEFAPKGKGKRISIHW